MTENNVKKAPTVSKVFGWISLVLSCLGVLGMILIVIAAAMPTYQGTSAQINSEGMAKAFVFFIGDGLGLMVSPLGGIAGLISMITMLTKRSAKMIWLPITGMALGAFAFVGTILASVALIEMLS